MCSARDYTKEECKFIGLFLLSQSRDADALYYLGQANLSDMEVFSALMDILRNNMGLVDVLMQEILPTRNEVQQTGKIPNLRTIARKFVRITKDAEPSVQSDALVLLGQTYFFT